MAESTKLKIEKFLEEVIKKDASDLHLTVGVPPMIRVDGSLKAIDGVRALTDKDVKNLTYSILDDVQKDILERDKEVDFSFTYGDLARFRANAYHQKGNVGLALRLIPVNIRTLTRSEEHTSELQSHSFISYAVFCLKKKKK